MDDSSFGCSHGCCAHLAAPRFFWIRDRLQIVDTLPRQAKAAFGVSVGVCTTEILLCDLVVSRALLLQANDPSQFDGVFKKSSRSTDDSKKLQKFSIFGAGLCAILHF